MTIVKVLFAITLAASVVAGQTKMSGSLECSQKGSEDYSIEVGDHPGHTYAIWKTTCTWTKPAEFAGLKTKDFTGATSAEINGNKWQSHSVYVGSVENGDKFYIRLQVNFTMTPAEMKDLKFESEEGPFNFTGGTGKLKGIKGTGTYKGKPEGDVTKYDIEGEYSLPSK